MLCSDFELEPFAILAHLNPYDLTFTFSRFLSEEAAELPGGHALANLRAPLLLSNAAWYPKVGELAGVAEWYAARGLHPALIVPVVRDADLERALMEGPFLLERAFRFRDVEPVGLEGDTVVEQVSWAQGRTLGETFAAAYGEPAYGVALGAALTKAMQAHPNITAYVAYQNEAVGAMVVFESEVLVATLLSDADGALEARLQAEARDRNLTPYVLEPLDENVSVKDGRSFERWSIS